MLRREVNRMIIRKKYKLIICILWLFCSVALNGCRDRQSEMLLAGQTETENTRTPEVTEAVDVEITKTAEVEKQTEPVESQPETVETPAKIFVDVCGAVANPGVYEMEDDSRIFQVIEAAGGFLPEAATRLVNQAQPVSDGQQIYVPTQEEAEAVCGCCGIYGADVICISEKRKNIECTKGNQRNI